MACPKPASSLLIGFPKRRLGILDRLQKLFGLCGLSVACPKLLGSRQASCGLSVACPKPASSLLMGFRRQREAFWTGFKSLSAAGRPLAASLWPVRSLLSSYGLPKATLGILDRLQKPLGSQQASCGLSVACPKPASSLLMGFRRQR